MRRFAGLFKRITKNGCCNQAITLTSTFRGVALALAVWHDVPVPDESQSERLRRESDELLSTAAKLIEHAETLKAQAAELKKQIARLEREASKQNRKKA